MQVYWMVDPRASRHAVRDTEVLLYVQEGETGVVGRKKRSNGISETETSDVGPSAVLHTRNRVMHDPSNMLEHWIRFHYPSNLLCPARALLSLLAVLCNLL